MLIRGFMGGDGGVWPGEEQELASQPQQGSAPWAKQGGAEAVLVKEGRTPRRWGPCSDPQQGEKWLAAEQGLGLAGPMRQLHSRDQGPPQTILVASSGPALPAPCLCWDELEAAPERSRESRAEGEHPLPPLLPTMTGGAQDALGFLGSQCP